MVQKVRLCKLTMRPVPWYTFLFIFHMMIQLVVFSGPIARLPKVAVTKIFDKKKMNKKCHTGRPYKADILQLACISGNFSVSRLFCHSVFVWAVFGDCQKFYFVLVFQAYTFC